MSAYELPAWLDTRFIENALSRTAAPDKAELGIFWTNLWL